MHKNVPGSKERDPEWVTRRSGSFGRRPMRNRERDPEWVARRRKSFGREPMRSRERDSGTESRDAAGESRRFASEHVLRLCPDISRAEHRKPRDQGERRRIQFWNQMVRATSG